MYQEEEYANTNGFKLVHQWVQRHYGKANKCESSDCSGISQKFEWSKLKGKPYTRDRDNFWQLCRSCHAKYDMTEKGRLRLIEYSSKPRHLQSQPVYQKSLDGKILRKFNSIKEAAQFVKINSTCIRSVLRGDTYTSAGYKWEKAPR